MYEEITTLHKKSISLKLYLRQNSNLIKNRICICLEDEAPVYWVEGNATGRILVISDADENKIMIIKKKLFSFSTTYIFLKNGEIIGKIRKKLISNRTVYSGELNNKKINIYGETTGYHFSIKEDDILSGIIESARLTWGDVHTIDIMEKENADTVVAMAAILYNSIKTS